MARFPLRSTVAWATPALTLMVGLVVVLVLVLALAPLPTLATEAPSAATPPPSAPSPIDAAIDRATAYLLDQQHDDGAWRSATYGLYRDGPSLTAHVLTALVRVAPDDERTQRGLAYLAGLVDEQGEIAAPLIMPVYTASQAAQVFMEAGRPDDARPWLALLLSHQMTEARGWSPDDLQYGGWGYSPRVPHRPDDDEQAARVDANLSATVFALAALRQAQQAGVMDVEAVVFDAARVHFLLRCQNVSAAGSIDADYDDGGFYFTPVDVVRNKAGVAGRDAADRQRFHAYGPPTADGYRALLLTGTVAGDDADDRLDAAERWLHEHFDPTTVPGTFNADREVLRDAYYFYYAWSTGLAFEQAQRHGRRMTDPADADEPPAEHWWHMSLAEQLLGRQADDGAWRNRFTDAKEDDPLVATPFAMRALWPATRQGRRE